MEKNVEQREKDVEQQEEDVGQREKSVEQREEDAGQREKNVEQREEDVEQQEEDADVRQEDVEKREAELFELCFCCCAALSQVIDDCDLKRLDAEKQQDYEQRDCVALPRSTEDGDL